MLENIVIDGIVIERKTNNYSVKKENTNYRLCNINVLSNGKYRVLTRSDNVNDLAPKGILIKTTYYKERGYRKYYFDLSYDELLLFLNSLSVFDVDKRIKYENEFKTIKSDNETLKSNSIIKIRKTNNR